MRRISRLVSPLVAAIVFAACSDVRAPSAPTVDATSRPPTGLSIVDGTTGGNPGVLILPPLRRLRTQRRQNQHAGIAAAASGADANRNLRSRWPAAARNQVEGREHGRAVS